MSKIIVTGHGSFASGIISSVELISGIDNNIVGIDFKSNHSTDELHNNLLLEINKDNEDLIILCDLLGGSPFKESCLIKEELKNRNIEVVGGVNLAMLLQGFLLKDDMNLNDLKNDIIKTGHEAISVFEVKLRKDILSEDGI